MRVFIAGMDGYLGWSLALYLSARGHDIAGADLLLRREWVEEIGSYSAIPIASPEARACAYAECFGRPLNLSIGDLCDFEFLREQLTAFQPDAIVHFGQMPSAPYSMMDVSRCVWTQTNNITSNLNLLWAMREVCPDAHLVKLGTMGEYGTPAVDIPEGFSKSNIAAAATAYLFRGSRAASTTSAKSTIHTTRSSPAKSSACARPT